MKKLIGILALGILMVLQGGMASAGPLEDRVAVLEALVAQLQAQIAQIDANPALDLGPYVSVDANTINGLAGPHVIFTGVNVHVRDGFGPGEFYDPPTGLGNLIVGYNDNNSSHLRTGSHNLVVGREHEYTSNGGFVAGYGNHILGPATSISGGTDNTATIDIASILGGEKNIASGVGSTISGGMQNTTPGYWSTVSGGRFNVTNGWYSSISGGFELTLAPTPYYSWAAGSLP